MGPVLLTVPPLAFGLCLELKTGDSFTLRHHSYGNASIPEVDLRWSEHLTSTSGDTRLLTEQILKGQAMWAEILLTNSRIPWIAGGDSTKVLECEFAVRPTPCVEAQDLLGKVRGQLKQIVLNPWHCLWWICSTGAFEPSRRSVSFL